MAAHKAADRVRSSFGESFEFVINPAQLFLLTELYYRLLPKKLVSLVELGER